MCFPVFSSISLDLLPERTATLMVYEEVVEIVSGLQGELTTSMSGFTCSGSITPHCTFEKGTRSYMNFSFSGSLSCMAVASSTHGDKNINIGANEG